MIDAAAPINIPPTAGLWGTSIGAVRINPLQTSDVAPRCMAHSWNVALRSERRAFSLLRGRGFRATFAVTNKPRPSINAIKTGSRVLN
jgi:hypothetical protein